MAKLLLNLRNVPDDETEEIRAVLEREKIAFYETQPSFWGVSGGGIWLRRREDLAKAEQLMAEYQRQRRAKALADYQAAKREGRVKSTWDSVAEKPLLAIGVLIGIAFLVFVLVLPFLILGH
ncbi:MAG TPA: DUF6164 family protein [Gammaproteobacteria bacterium]|nr:DUF6164 family protein [Gammaproteobacteria bacterium]